MLDGFYLKFKEKRLRRHIDNELPEAVDMLAMALRAGRSLEQAIDFVSHEGPRHVALEFRGIIEEVKLGRGIDEVLEEWEKRLSLEDIRVLVESIIILRQTGGNLAEVFSIIAATIRERHLLAERIRTFTSSARYQAILLSLLPFALMAGLAFMSPWYVKPLVSSWLGRSFLFAMVFFQSVGFVWMRSISRIEI